MGKAVLKPPQSKRFAIAGRIQAARSVWTAACSPPLFERSICATFPTCPLCHAVTGGTPPLICV